MEYGLMENLKEAARQKRAAKQAEHERQDREIEEGRAASWKQLLTAIYTAHPYLRGCIDEEKRPAPAHSTYCDPLLSNGWNAKVEISLAGHAPIYMEWGRDDGKWSNRGWGDRDSVFRATTDYAIDDDGKTYPSYFHDTADFGEALLLAEEAYPKRAERVESHKQKAAKYAERMAEKKTPESTLIEALRAFVRDMLPE